MEPLKLFLKRGRSGYRECADPKELPGVRKKSFSLPFRGGEIWFEHLDGMYQYTELVLQKLWRDSLIFLLPSRPSQIGFVLNETRITPDIAAEITKLLCSGEKAYTRVCFIGADRRAKRVLRSALGGESGFAYTFISDTEKAKEWLIPQ